MSIVSGEKDLLNQLLSAESVSLKVQLVRYVQYSAHSCVTMVTLVNYNRRIRNSVIGNRKRKRLFLSSQAIQMYVACDSILYKNEYIYNDSMVLLYYCIIYLLYIIIMCIKYNLYNYTCIYM